MTDFSAALLHTAPDALFVVDDRGAIVACNRRAERLFGIAGDEVRGLPVVDVIVPGRLQAWARDHLIDAVRDDSGQLRGRASGLVVRVDGGSERYAEALVEPIDDVPSQVALWVRPGTSLTTDAESLQPDDGDDVEDVGRYTWWAQTGHMRWSPKVYEILGRDPGDGDPAAEAFAEQLHPADRHKAGPAADGFESPHFEYRVIRTDGSVRTIEASRRVTRDADGMIERVDGVVRDVTDHRQALAVLAAHRAMQDVLVSWENCAESIGALLERVGSALGSSVAALYVPGSDGRTLACRGCWMRLGDEEFDAFARLSLAGTTRADALVGRAFRDRAVVTSPDVTRERAFARAEAAERAGLRSAVAIPAVHGEELLAVLELYTCEHRVYDDTARVALTLIGEQLGAFLARHRGDLRPGMLTPREVEVLQLAAQGNGVAAIADSLAVSCSTVRTHFRNIHDRLGVHDRAAAVAEGMRLGIIS